METEILELLNRIGESLEVIITALIVLAGIGIKLYSLWQKMKGEKSNALKLARFAYRAIEMAKSNEAKAAMRLLIDNGKALNQSAQELNHELTALAASTEKEKEKHLSKLSSKRRGKILTQLCKPKGAGK